MGPNLTHPIREGTNLPIVLLELDVFSPSAVSTQLNPLIGGRYLLVVTMGKL